MKFTDLSCLFFIEVNFLATIYSLLNIVFDSSIFVIGLDFNNQTNRICSVINK